MPGRVLLGDPQSKEAGLAVGQVELTLKAESCSSTLREGPVCAGDLSVNLGFAWLTARELL